MANAVLVVLTVVYPFAVYFLLDRLDARTIAFGLLCLVAARLVVLNSRVAAPQYMRWILAILALFALAVAAADSHAALLYYPLLVNVLLLLVFGYSLLRPPSIIERLARLTEPDLPERAVRYTRGVTAVWCGFFVLNGAIAAYTAAFASLAAWSLYNGFVAYIAMGVLFGAEWLVRRRVRES